MMHRAWKRPWTGAGRPRLLRREPLTLFRECFGPSLGGRGSSDDSAIMRGWWWEQQAAAFAHEWELKMVKPSRQILSLSLFGCVCRAIDSIPRPMGIRSPAPFLQSKTTHTRSFVLVCSLFLSSRNKPTGRPVAFHFLPVAIACERVRVCIENGRHKQHSQLFLSRNYSSGRSERNREPTKRTNNKARSIHFSSRYRKEFTFTDWLQSLRRKKKALLVQQKNNNNNNNNDQILIIRVLCGKGSYTCTYNREGFPTVFHYGPSVQRTDTVDHVVRDGQPLFLRHFIRYYIQSFVNLNQQIIKECMNRNA